MRAVLLEGGGYGAARERGVRACTHSFGTRSSYSAVLPLAVQTQGNVCHVPPQLKQRTQFSPFKPLKPRLQFKPKAMFVTRPRNTNPVDPRYALPSKASSLSTDPILQMHVPDPSSSRGCAPRDSIQVGAATARAAAGLKKMRMYVTAPKFRAS